MVSDRNSITQSVVLTIAILDSFHVNNHSLNIYQMSSDVRLQLLDDLAPCP